MIPDTHREIKFMGKNNCANSMNYFVKTLFLVKQKKLNLTDISIIFSIKVY